MGSQNTGYRDNYGNSYMYGGGMNSALAAEELPKSERLNAPLSDAPSCDVSPWGDWSDCSSRCDSGSRTRHRRYLNLERSSDCSDELYEVQPCRGNEADCPPPREPNGTPTYGQQPEVTNMGFSGYGSGQSNANMDGVDPACQTSDWSNWSPCSQKCGSGYQRRTRLYLLPFVPNRSCDVRLYDKQDCYGQDASCAEYGQYQGSYPTEVDQYEKSTNIVIQDLAEKNTVDNLKNYDASENPDAPSICTAPVDPGSCHGHTERWYFDSDQRFCKAFSYTGCTGNRNNFATREKCEATCLDNDSGYINQRTNTPEEPSSYWSSGGSNSQYYDSSYAAPSSNAGDDSFNQFPALNLLNPSLYNTGEESAAPTEDEEIPMRPMTPLNFNNEIDCQVSAWSVWSPCSTSCGTGWEVRHREILVNPSTYGKGCPKKLSRKRKCRQMPCPADTKYWYQGSWRHMVDPDDE